MDLITALAICISVLAGVAAFVLLSPFGLGLQIWVALIAWATFYHCGGKEAGLTKAITLNIFGAVMALIMLLLVVYVPLGALLGSPLWIGICVFITLFILVYATKVAMLNDIAACILGYAALAGFALEGKNMAVAAGSLDNPFIKVVISLVIGAALGYIAEKAAGALAKK
ncbi:MAG: DUF1097 domain-containing protein [Roseiarcus sp.]|jgi:hypothetical protein